jgi:hypothetical protein
MNVDFSRLGFENEVFDRSILRGASFEHTDLRKASFVDVGELIYIRH